MTDNEPPKGWRYDSPDDTETIIIMLTKISAHLYDIKELLKKVVSENANDAKETGLGSDAESPGNDRWRKPKINHRERDAEFKQPEDHDF